MKFLKIFFIIFSLIFLNGCLQTTALLGPGITVATTGNVLQAGFQYGANTVIENETGKNTLEHFQSALDSKKKKKFKEKFTNLVEKKFELTRKKLKLN
jgi:DNA integrity scanning protein DisA with diadenylate cyclase activity